MFAHHKPRRCSASMPRSWAMATASGWHMCWMSSQRWSRTPRIHSVFWPISTWDFFLPDFFHILLGFWSNIFRSQFGSYRVKIDFANGLSWSPLFGQLPMAMTIVTLKHFKTQFWGSAAKQKKKSPILGPPFHCTRLELTTDGSLFRCAGGSRCVVHCAGQGNQKRLTVK